MRVDSDYYFMEPFPYLVDRLSKKLINEKINQLKTERLQLNI